MKKWILPSIFIVLVALFYIDFPSSKQENADEATVLHVIDGDTVKVQVNGNTENVRLLLVDTPETNLPSGAVQPYGLEATSFADELLDNQEITLEYDGPKRDRYDRLLAYIWIDGELYNQLLLEEGYARLAYIFDPPYAHFETLKEAEEQARANQIRIWSKEGYVTEDGFVGVE